MQNACSQIFTTLVKILIPIYRDNLNNPQWSETKLGVKDQVKTGALKVFNINNLAQHSVRQLAELLLFIVHSPRFRKLIGGYSSANRRITTSGLK